MSLRTQCALSDSLLAKLGEFVEARLGLHFPHERWLDLERGARAASDECSDDPVRYVDRLLGSSTSAPEIQALARHLTIGETHFFRETLGLRVLEEQIVPNVKDRQLHIWSAGCATGEEPYSVAMLLRRIIPNLERWNISILGTDINTRSLDKARKGLYGEWSFRGVSEWIRTAWFSRSPDGRWAIDPALKNMVRFTCWNLVSEELPEGSGTVDVIFCCNVLMYLSPDAARRAAGHLYRCLKPGGWLIVSPVEVSQALFHEFEQVTFPGGTAYRRRPFPVETPAMQPVPADSADHISMSGNAVQSEAELPRPSRNRVPAMMRLARACANRGKLPEAFRWCEIAIATEAGDARIHYLRAAILEEQGILDEAARSLRRALYLEPRFVMGHFALGNLSARLGRLKESAKHFENTMILLATYQPEDILPESSGLTAGRLQQLILRRING